MSGSLAHPVARPREHLMWLLATALLGFTIPNGFFLYWLFFEYRGVRPVLHDHLALGFILDVLLALVILSVYFWRRPVGPVKGYWFVAPSCLLYTPPSP